MSKYASSTSVSSDKSRAEIERTLQRYGAESFMYGWDQENAVIGFKMNGLQMRFVLPMPDRDQFKFTAAKRQRRTPEAQQKAWEQATRQRWRALALVIKAKLEAVEAGISVFEDEFLANIMLPDGRSAGQWMIPQIHHIYETGVMPPMLPALSAGSDSDPDVIAIYD